MGLVQELERIEGFIRAQVTGAGADGVVVGLSGGVDSAVVAALAMRACAGKVLGVIMPCHSHPQDREHGLLVAKALAIPVEEVDLTLTFDTLLTQLSAQYDPKAKELAVANLKPRLRMTTLYYWAARHNYLVAGTGNRAEAYIGYFTKYGDSGVDMLPIAGLVKSQVWEAARLLGVPQEIIDKPPSAGLWANQTDEGEMGFSYAQLDRYLLTGEGDPEVIAKIEAMHRCSEHKRHFPAMP